MSELCSHWKADLWASQCVALVANKYSVVPLSSYSYPLPLADLSEEILSQFKATLLFCLPKSKNQSPPFCLFLQPFCHIVVNLGTFCAAAPVQVWEHVLLKAVLLGFPKVTKRRGEGSCRTPPLCFPAIPPGSTLFLDVFKEVEKRLTQSMPPSLCWIDYMSVQMMWTHPLVLQFGGFQWIPNNLSKNSLDIIHTSKLFTVCFSLLPPLNL